MYCFLRVYAADELMVRLHMEAHSFHNFCRDTSMNPPLPRTVLYRRCRSRGCFDIVGDVLLEYPLSSLKAVSRSKKIFRSVSMSPGGGGQECEGGPPIGGGGIPVIIFN